jgi:hypothetical protein
LTGGHSACQNADVAVLKGSLGPEGDFDRLLAVSSGTDVAFKGYVNDPEPNLGLGRAPAAGSNTVTFGEPVKRPRADAPSIEGLRSRRL